MTGNKFDFAFFCLMAVIALVSGLVAIWIHTEIGWSHIVDTRIWLFALYVVLMVACAIMGVLTVAEKLIDYRSGWYPADADLASVLHKWLYRERDEPGPNAMQIYAALRNVRNERLGRPL